MKFQSITESMGDSSKLPSPVVEVPDFKGGVNGTEAAVHEVPEYKETASNSSHSNRGKLERFG